MSNLIGIIISIILLDLAYEMTRDTPFFETFSATIIFGALWMARIFVVNVLYTVGSILIPGSKSYLEAVKTKNTSAKKRWDDKRGTEKQERLMLQRQRKEEAKKRLLLELKTLGSMSKASLSELQHGFQETKLWNAWQIRRFEEIETPGPIPLICNRSNTI